MALDRQRNTIWLHVKLQTPVQFSSDEMRCEAIRAVCERALRRTVHSYIVTVCNLYQHPIGHSVVDTTISLSRCRWNRTTRSVTPIVHKIRRSVWYKLATTSVELCLQKLSILGLHRGEARYFIVGEKSYGMGTGRGVSPRYGCMGLCPVTFKKHGIQICRLWCILTAIKNLLLADDWMYSGWLPNNFLSAFCRSHGWPMHPVIYFFSPTSLALY